MSLLSNVAALATEAIRFVAKLETGSMLAKSMESQIKRACFWGGLFAVVVLVLLGGTGLIIAGVFILLTPITGVGLAAIIVGVIVAIIAAALIIATKSCIR
jgi:amino acid transporter